VSIHTPFAQHKGEHRVLVVGTMAFDAKGQPNERLVPGTSAPGVVHLGIGGVGRNIAENLVRLGIKTTLLSAVGDDAIGRSLLYHTARSGVDVSHVDVSPEYGTAAYIAVLDRSGELAHAIDDMAVAQAVTPSLVYRRRRLVRDSSLIVIDANLPTQTIDSVFKLARRYDRPVCVDPTSAILAPLVQPHLPDIYLVVPNLREAEILAGFKYSEEEDIQHLAMELVNKGVEVAIITLAEKGLYYATSDENGHVPALQRDIVDVSGAGDALAAAVIFGLLNEMPISEAVRLGISAAALTVQCPETVCPDLSLDRLYDELAV
jgi:pseudouridine kinase